MGINEVPAMPTSPGCRYRSDGSEYVLVRRAVWKHDNMQAVHMIMTGLGPAGSSQFRKLDSQDGVGQVGMEAEEKGRKHIHTLPGTLCLTLH